MKTVAILGAGPGGLIVCRKLLQAGQFQVTVFEKSIHIGGSWAAGQVINPDMRSNQTKFSMSFSDLSWESLSRDTFFPTFPKAHHVARYLNEYAQRFIPADVIRLGTEIVSVERVVENVGYGEQRTQWAITARSIRPNGIMYEEQLMFDYFVAAPGMLSHPNQLHCETEPDLIRNSPVPILHSTQYRNLSDINSNYDNGPRGKFRIVVVGGSHSGSDVASLIALQISDSYYAPEDDGTVGLDRECEIIHVTSHEMIALPPFVRDSDHQFCTFKPIDLLLFDRSSRPVDPPPSFTFGLTTPERAAVAREMIYNIMKGDEGLLGMVDDEFAPYGVSSDTYTQFVQKGDIHPVRGTVTKIETSLDGQSLSLAITNQSEMDQDFRIDDVGVVIHATGFDVNLALSFLSEYVKDALGFNANCPQAPLLLDTSCLSQNRLMPNIAFIGFSGPHWGLFEMQARAIVAAWTQEDTHSNPFAHQAPKSELLQYYYDLRSAIQQGWKAQIPQNPFGDHVGHMEQASRELRLERFDYGCSDTSGFICSSRYLDPGSDKLEAMKTMSRVYEMRRQARDSGLFLARAVFHGLLGDWIAARKGKNGRLQTILLEFHPRLPTDDKYDWEYLCAQTEVASDRVFRYREADDEITVWSVSEDNPLQAESILYRLDFNHESQMHGRDTAVAAGVVDIPGGAKAGVIGAYRFSFAGSMLQTFVISDGHETQFVRCGKKKLDLGGREF